MNSFQQASFNTMIKSMCDALYFNIYKTQSPSADLLQNLVNSLKQVLVVNIMSLSTAQ